MLSFCCLLFLWLCFDGRLRSSPAMVSAPYYGIGTPAWFPNSQGVGTFIRCNCEQMESRDPVRRWPNKSRRNGAGAGLGFRIEGLGYRRSLGRMNRSPCAGCFPQPLSKPLRIRCTIRPRSFIEEARRLISEVSQSFLLSSLRSFWVQK